MEILCILGTTPPHSPATPLSPVKEEQKQQTRNCGNAARVRRGDCSQCTAPVPIAVQSKIENAKSKIRLHLPPTTYYPLATRHPPLVTMSLANLTTESRQFPTRKLPVVDQKVASSPPESCQLSTRKLVVFHSFAIFLRTCMKTGGEKVHLTSSLVPPNLVTSRHNVRKRMFLQPSAFILHPWSFILGLWTLCRGAVPKAQCLKPKARRRALPSLATNHQSLTTHSNVAWTRFTCHLSLVTLICVHPC